MFKNERDLLTSLVRKHAEGEVDIPSELDLIMIDEATELIKNEYDNKQGDIDLYGLLARHK